MRGLVRTYPSRILGNFELSFHFYVGKRGRWGFSPGTGVGFFEIGVY